MCYMMRKVRDECMKIKKDVEKSQKVTHSTSERGEFKRHHKRRREKTNGQQAVHVIKISQI